MVTARVRQFDHKNEINYPSIAIYDHLSCNNLSPDFHKISCIQHLRLTYRFI